MAHSLWTSAERRAGRSLFLGHGRMHRNRKRKRSGSFAFPRKRAKRALTTRVSQLERKTKGEPKVIVIADATAAVDNTGDVLHMVGITQGIAVNQRIGNEILVTGVGLHIQCTKHATPTTSQIRIILFMDRRTVIGGVPTIATVLNAVQPNSYIHSLRKQRFRILMDKWIVLETNKITWRYKFWKTVSIRQKYSGAANNTQESNAIYLLILSDQAVNTVAYRDTRIFVYTDA